MADRLQVNLGGKNS